MLRFCSVFASAVCSPARRSVQLASLSLPESKNRLIVIRIQDFFVVLSILKFRQKFLLARQGNGGIFFIYKPCKFTEHLEDVFS